MNLLQLQMDYLSSSPPSARTSPASSPAKKDSPLHKVVQAAEEKKMRDKLSSSSPVSTRHPTPPVLPHQSSSSSLLYSPKHPPQQSLYEPRNSAGLSNHTSDPSLDDELNALCGFTVDSYGHVEMVKHTEPTMILPPNDLPPPLPPRDDLPGNRLKYHFLLTV